MATGKGNSKIHVQGGKREKKVTNRQLPRFSSVELTVQTNNKGKISEILLNQTQIDIKKEI